MLNDEPRDDADDHGERGEGHEPEFRASRARFAFGIVQTVIIALMSAGQLYLSMLTLLLQLGCDVEPDAFRCVPGVAITTFGIVIVGGLGVLVVGSLVTWLPKRRPSYWGLPVAIAIQVPTLGFGMAMAYYG